MDKQEHTPIELMAQLLANMTERAMNAERERDAERENSNEWYHLYKSKGEELSAVKTELEVTKTKLEAATAELEHKKLLIEEAEKKLKLLTDSMPNIAFNEKEDADNA